MASFTAPPDRTGRVRAAILVAALHALIAWGIVSGLAVDFVRAVETRLQVVAIAPDPPPPPPPERTVPAPVRIPDPEGAAAPPSLKSRPSPVVAPREAPRSPVRAAPEPKPLPTGSARDAGASTTPGTGTGAGGEGSGAGAGRGGSGTGGGGRPMRAQKIAGSISGEEDYFRALRRRAFNGTVRVRIEIAADGRVAGCRVTGSSGDPAVDANTCRLVEQRYRYRPARDADGNPVPDVTSASFSYEWRPAAPRGD
ncbi:MAG TPA: TonB family protein [Allosphingosinicella sp.]|nr:TonB family protein [Allosphingosinicella sp.]